MGSGWNLDFGIGRTKFKPCCEPGVVLMPEIQHLKVKVGEPGVLGQDGLCGEFQARQGYCESPSQPN